jgi:adenylate kinase
MRVIVIFGPPGVGKGTQAKLLAEKLGIEHVSTGAILRQEMGNKSEIGLKAKEVMAKGELLSDDLIMKMLEKHVSESSADGFLFDGVPRTLAQAEMFLSIMQNKSIENIKVVNLDAPEDEIIDRLLKRAEIEGREDDNKETIVNRIRVYNKQTLPVLEFFRENNVEVLDVNGLGIIEEIHKNILEVL